MGAEGASHAHVVCRYALALRQFAAGRPREAIDSAMAVVKADRCGNERVAGPLHVEPG